jgi:hypothetical protein
MVAHSELAFSSTKSVFPQSDFSEWPEARASHRSSPPGTACTTNRRAAALANQGIYRTVAARAGSGHPERGNTSVSASADVDYRGGRSWCRGRSRKHHYDLSRLTSESCAISSLLLKRASTSRPSGEWSDDDYDMLADRAVVGRIMQAAASPVGALWMWTLIFGHKGRTPTHSYAATREAAMARMFCL